MGKQTQVPKSVESGREFVVFVMMVMLTMVMLTKVMLTMVWNMMMRESLVRGGCNCNARAASLGDPQVSPDVPTLEF